MALTVAQLADRLRIDNPGSAGDAIYDNLAELLATARLAGYWYDQPPSPSGLGHAAAFVNSGAASLLAFWQSGVDRSVSPDGIRQAATATPDQPAGSVGNPVTNVVIVTGTLTVTFADGETSEYPIAADEGTGLTPVQSALLAMVAANIAHLTNPSSLPHIHHAPPTLADLSNFLVGLPIQSGGTVTFNLQDGSTGTITLPMAGEPIADGVINSVSLDDDTQVLTINTSTNTPFSIDFTAAIEAVGAGLSQAEVDARVAPWARANSPDLVPLNNQEHFREWGNAGGGTAWKEGSWVRQGTGWGLVNVDFGQAVGEQPFPNEDVQEFYQVVLISRADWVSLAIKDPHVDYRFTV